MTLLAIRPHIPKKYVPVIMAAMLKMGLIILYVYILFEREANIKETARLVVVEIAAAITYTCEYKMESV